MQDLARIRKYLLAGIGLAVLLYSVIVLLYVRAYPDLGFQCVMSTVVGQVTRPTAYGDSLQVGDRLVSIRGRPIFKYTDVLGATESVAAKEVEAWLPVGHPLPSHLVDVVQGDRRLVRVEFERPVGGMPAASQPVPRTAWAEVGSVPSATYVLAVLWFVLQLGIFAIGALVVWRRPQDRAAVLFFLLCATNVGAYMGGYHWSVIAAEPLLITVFVICAMLLPAVSLHFYLVFPQPKAWLRRHPRRSWALVYGPAVVGLVSMLGLIWGVTVTAVYTHDTAVLERSLQGIRYLSTWYMGLAAVYFLACMASLIHSLVTSRSRLERNQLRWIVAGAVPATGMLGYTLYLAAADLPRFVLGSGTVPMFLASLFFTLGYALAIVRTKFMRVQEIVNRSMVYFAISFAAAMVYYGLIALIALVVGTHPSLVSRVEQAVGVILTVVVLASVLGWIYSRFQKALDRRFYRDRYQLERAMRHLSEAVGRVQDSATVAQRTLATIMEAAGAVNGAIYLQDQDRPDDFVPVARMGGNYRPTALPPGNPVRRRLAREAVPLDVARLSSPQDDPELGQLTIWGGRVAFPMSIEGRLVGLLCLGPKRSESPYEPEELAFLGALAQISAMMAETAHAYRTIRRLSADLEGKVTKIAEQQRRIMVLQERLMKDSVGPAALPAGAPDFSRLKGCSPAVQQLMSMAAKVAASDAAVLILGESGTGKGLLAEVIHANSRRAGRPFVKVHCAALSPGLLESELFGHVKGAFTGAFRDKEGHFQRADGGTLFLDEIGDIGLETQTKLLRVLQEKAFERVGSTETIHVDVRLIAATHQDLPSLIRRGLFREDLYYRLNVISLRCPALRERREDVFELAMHFLQKYAEKAGKRIRQIDDRALTLLQAYDWPGNIRQLENVIERAVVLAESEELTADDLPEEVRRGPTPAAGSLGVAGPDNGDGHGRGLLRGEVAAVERQRLAAALHEAGGNKSVAARALGIPRSTLISKLKKYGLD